MGTGAAGGHPAGQPVPDVWQPPTEVERALHRAGEREDWPAYYRTLAATDLFFPMRRDIVDALPGVLRPAIFRDPQVRGLCVAVFTRGMLPPPDSGDVFERGDLLRIAKSWPRSASWLAVNPGTPVETFLPAEPRRWKRHARRAAPEPPLKTWFTGPLTGPLAHGLACGALLMVSNGAIWNHLGWQSGGYSEERALLRRWWGVTGRDGWLQAQEQLLRGDMLPAAWEFVLEVRQVLLQEDGVPPKPVQWREAVEAVLVARTAELVDRTGRPPDFDLDSDIALIQKLIGRILRYEARFRADGVLAEDGLVRSVLAWDLGRASCMARWGLGARYCGQAETETAVLRAGETARGVYGSWEEFSAGYILGRCLHFDSEEYGDWYTEMLAAHRLLTADPRSPWRTVSFLAPAGEGDLPDPRDLTDL
ncbi:DUF1266 domain-containing protein [Streptomyces sodiiphilus]|uniref:DUF1266 domain-containing protein n=1 Tax=Streptomyces sodiiphilus TaxID=226217 RepID=A0ABP5ATQ4_9ACTN